MSSFSNVSNVSILFNIKNSKLSCYNCLEMENCMKEEEKLKIQITLQLEITDCLNSDIIF